MKRFHRKRSIGLAGFLCKALRMKNAMPCVGLVVLAGCLTFIVAPDDGPTIESQVDAVFNAFPTIIIDAGHGGKDDGARGNGLTEKDLCLDVALRIEKFLKPFNFPTVLTRRDDTFIPLEERSAIANRIDNAIFVSIHFNHVHDRVSTGVETFYARQKVPTETPWTWVGYFNKPEPVVPDNGETLAGFIQTALVMRLDAVNRGIKGRDLFVTRHTRCPAVLVEGGFINNPLEATLISNGEYRDRIARAVAEGIMSYQKTRPRPSASPTKLAQAAR